MITADSLNLDVLELIFCNLNGNDLVSLSLVNRKFLSGVIPSLYRTLVFKQRQAKRFSSMVSPFTAVLSHPSLATHVRGIDIRASPLLRGQIHPTFIRDCLAILELAENLSAFSCTEPKIFPLLLPHLPGKEHLRDIRITTDLSCSQSETLLSIAGVRDISLYQASWNVVDVLPRWMMSNASTLLHLSLNSSHNLNHTVLESLLSTLPELRSLRVVGCSKLDHHNVIRLCNYTPKLESLAFTIWEKARSDSEFVYPLCPELRQLSIDTKIVRPSTEFWSIWTSIITSFATALTSCALKLSDTTPINDAFLEALIESHAESLRTLTFTNVTLSTDDVEQLCYECLNLETLGLMLNGKDLIVEELSNSLGSSATLRTLINSADVLRTHESRLALTRSSVLDLMENVPVLRRVISDKREWIGRDNSFGVELAMEKMRPSSPDLAFVFS